ncbi:MAG: hypothetical protein K8J08_16250, partial [Thermoanaerobaculia bacterium]|nr:hypothetical protein [Thermoanaerobaculia bacterium]
ESSKGVGVTQGALHKRRLATTKVHYVPPRSGAQAPAYPSTTSLPAPVPGPRRRPWNSRGQLPARDQRL